MVRKEEDHKRELYRRLGALIRKARGDAGLTQAELSSLISLSRPSLANIESGRQRVHLHTIIEMASALNVDVPDLIPEMRAQTLDEFGGDLPENLSDEEREWITALIIRS